MTRPSNLYAEKIFAEHPLEMWTLDEETSYLSWINESARNLKTWTVDNNSNFSIYLSTDNGFDDAQYNQDSVIFPESFQQQISFSSVSSPEIVRKFYSPDLNFSSSQIDSVSGCISLGTMFFSNDETISKIRIGYAIDLGGANEDIHLKECTNLKYSEWVNLVETLPIQPTQNSLSFKMVIEVTAQQSPNQADLFLNGIVVGQGAEYFSKTSLGIKYGSIPNSIYLPQPYFSQGYPGEEREGIEIVPYGLSDAKGYYLIYNDFELVSQSGIPMVYGSNTSTVLNPTPNKAVPNMILPAKGFMNELNNNRKRTFEFWMKLNHNGTSDSGMYKIFGPLANDDGLYVDESFLLLKIGDQVVSSFIEEWGKPMLIHVAITENVAYVMVNARIIMSIEHNGFSQKYKDAYDNDWVGFYAPKEIVDSIELDCVAVYTFDVREDLAKRRYVYGQGVEFPLALNSAYGGTSAYIDFSKSGYSKTQDYPTINKWNSGIHQNLYVDKDIISAPKYALPSLSYNSPVNNSSSFANWSSENYETMTLEHPGIAGFMPNPKSNANAYLEIQNISNFYGVPASSVIGMTKINSMNDGNQILSIKNKSTSSKIAISIKNIDTKKNLVYSIFKNAVEYDVYSIDVDDKISANEEIIFGVVLSDFCTSVEALSEDIYANAISLSMDEFKSVDYLSISIGADSDTDNAIDAIFTKLSIMTNIDYDRLKSKDQNFESSIEKGIFNYNGGQYASIETFRSFYSTYEIKASLHYPQNFVDIATYGYWSDTVPLSAMLSNIQNGDSVVSDLDFFQININYPSNIDSKIIKTYVYFQYPELFTMDNSEFMNRTTVSATNNLVVTPGQSWSGNKYEIKDGSIVYSPLSEGGNTPENVSSFDISKIVATFVIEISIDSPTVQPIQIKYLKIAPVSLDYDFPKKIGTRYGASISPSSIIDGIDYFKAKTPYRIYRDSAEYLNLTTKSGIELCSDNDSSRNLYIDINSELQRYFNISSMQFAFNHRGYFSETPELAFSIETPTKIIDLYVQSINQDNTRGIIIAKIGDSYFNDISYYINGIEVRSPILKRGEWNMLGMSFSPALSFPALAGKFRIFSKILINNFSYYQVSQDLINQYQIFKKWSEIENSSWEYWSNNLAAAPNTWDSVRTTEQSKAISIDAVDVYKIFVGTNKILSDSRSDDLSFAIPYYQYSFYNNVSSKSYVKKPI